MVTFKLSMTPEVPSADHHITVISPQGIINGCTYCRFYGLSFQWILSEIFQSALERSVSEH